MTQIAERRFARIRISPKRGVRVARDRIRVTCIVGTRPEVIKMSPVIRQFAMIPDTECHVLATGQHREMVDQLFADFGITSDIDLNIMKPAQSLSYMTSELAKQLDWLFSKTDPGVVLVQGDTTSAFMCALVAFYHKVPVGHVEAGLRTYDPLSPYPEEMNRQLISRLTTFNFAPTTLARDNLLSERIDADTIFVTGNTVVDALQFLLADDRSTEVDRKFQFPGKKTIVVTAHRRENHGKPLENICRALNTITSRLDDVVVIFPVHPNPAVRETVNSMLTRNQSILLCEPMAYTELIRVMASSTLLLTDSGGIQEEAPTLKKPVLIMRDHTERPEILESGFGKLVGTDTKKIVSTVERILLDDKLYESMRGGKNPFGDGLAAKRIVNVISKYFNDGAVDDVPMFK